MRKAIETLLDQELEAISREFVTIERDEGHVPRGNETTVHRTTWKNGQTIKTAIHRWEPDK